MRVKALTVSPDYDFNKKLFSDSDNTQIFNTKIVGHELQAIIETNEDKVNATVKTLDSSSIPFLKNRDFDTEEQAKKWINYILHKFYLDLRGGNGK